MDIIRQSHLLVLCISVLSAATASNAQTLRIFHIDVLKAQEGHDETYIFPGTKGAHISDMAMLMLLRDMGEYKDEDGRDIVTHGFRSTFRTWAAESTNAAHDICEAALAHTVKNKVSAAYQHSDLLEKRRALMNAWATHAIVKTGGSVAQFKAG